MITNPSSQLNSLHTHTSLSTTSSSRDTIQAWIEHTAVTTATSILPLPRKRKRSESLTPPLTESTTPINKRARRSTSAPTETTSADMPGDMGAPTPPSSQFQTASSTLQSASTPSRRASKSRINTSDPGQVGQRMEQYGLYQNETAFEVKYPDFQVLVMKIIEVDRDSAMKPGSAKDICNNVAFYGTVNEDSFLTEVLPLLVKKTYGVPANPRQQKTNLADQTVGESYVDVAEKDLRDGQQYAAKNWFDEGVVTITSREFVKDFLPFPFDAELIKELKKQDDMTNGKPDRCYGLRPNRFPHPQGLHISLELKEYLQVMPSIYHPYFILEGKSNQGKPADAQNQARRGGAILVHSLRSLLALIGVPEVSGADDRTFVFSATMASDHIQLWVHWAEVLSDRVLYHMNFLEGIALLDKKRLPDMRKYIDNILEWGSINRATQLTKYHEIMHEWQRNEIQRMIREKHEREQAVKNARNANKRPRTASSSAAEGSSNLSP